MQELLENFSNYLRLSFDVESSKSTVALKRELDLLKSYLYIEKARFEDRIKIEWEIEEHLYKDLNFKIPLLSLQPIVENAIKHGILKKVIGGTVKIIIKERNHYCEIRVEDNGVGIPLEKLNSLLIDSKPINGKRSISLVNINKRLKTLYNEELIIKSIENKETIVSFKIKK